MRKQGNNIKLVAYDPGKHHVGEAWFQDGELIACSLLRETDKGEGILEDLPTTIDADEAMIEIPQVYQQRSWKGDPNDLIQIALVAGALAHAVAPFGFVSFVRPHAWKGNAKKEAIEGWIRARLSPAESAVLAACDVPASLKHNVIDAVGIGMWALGRLGKS